MRQPNTITIATYLLSACLLAGCATPSPSACRPGERAIVVDTLYFGTQMSLRTVSADEWANFLRNQVTTAFPNGFTTWTTIGQSRRGDGSTVYESTHVLQISHPDSPSDDQALKRLSFEYRRLYQQDSVLHLRTPACVL
ncbi:MAG: DUF3574 domain-containing protein [Nitrospiraceae bacterium]